ncbi:MAG: type II secretion system protein [bacterium]|jgi:hypothetical protein|nr:prepilin-type N-terminal cleavage/methylation domain-containing protein [Phycisphaerales bacterium]MCE2654342.1 prepilin-type N-terminal cleavage/methylation domain-containing protein [Planctomycetaceae bacterium]
MPSRPPTSRSGLTLVELLVTIGVIGLIVALTIVGMRHVGTQSKVPSDLGKMQAIGAGFSLYNQDFQEAFPLFTTIGSFSTELRGEGLPPQKVSYFEAASTWHIVLARPYFSAPPTSDIFFPSSNRVADYARRPKRTTFLYPCAFIARPEFWRPETRMVDTPQLGATRTSEVAFPSAKALIVRGPVPNAPAPVLPEFTPVLFTDGSARDLPRAEHASGYLKGCGIWWDNYGGEHHGDTPPLLHTIGGVQGRDVRPVAGR